MNSALERHADSSLKETVTGEQRTLCPALEQVHHVMPGMAGSLDRMHLHEPTKDVSDVAVVHDVGAVHHTFISASIDSDAWVGLGETVVVARVVPMLVSRKDSLQADTLDFQ